jgi:hypothetical protein
MSAYMNIWDSILVNFVILSCSFSCLVVVVTFFLHHCAVIIGLNIKYRLPSLFVQMNKFGTIDWPFWFSFFYCYMILLPRTSIHSDCALVNALDMFLTLFLGFRCTANTDSELPDIWNFLRSSKSWTNSNLHLHSYLPLACEGSEGGCAKCSSSLHSSSTSWCIGWIFHVSRLLVKVVRELNYPVEWRLEVALISFFCLFLLCWVHVSMVMCKYLLSWIDLLVNDNASDYGLIWHSFFIRISSCIKQQVSTQLISSTAF